jgi:hypothetical protein
MMSTRSTPQGILDPRTGKPAGADDGFFLGLNSELADKGFLVAAADELIIWARTGSLMWMTFGLACDVDGEPQPMSGWGFLYFCTFN